MGGDILVTVIVFAAIVVTVTIGLVNWGASMLMGIRTIQAKEQAFQIAEAGIDYYRWHLAQYPTDYTNGTSTPGPYYKNFFDKDGNLLGQYSLAITPPPNGSTKVVITSTATTTSKSNAKRVLQVTLGEPSLAQYAVVANDNMRFGAGTVIHGPVSSNQGIRFDGVAYNLISSALATDTDPDNTSCYPYPACATEWGVWTSVSPTDPQPPTAVSAPPNDHSTDVFLTGRQYPAPAFPFASLTVNLNNLHTIANNGVSGGSCTTATGPCWKASGSGNYGYYIHINTNNTYDIYKVTGLQSAPSGCSNDGSPQWGTWSYTNLGAKIGTYAIPANGVIFIEDNLWVDGTNVGQSAPTRVTIATAANISNMSSTTGSNITVNNNLTYATYDGSTVIGLIAQANMNVGMVSADALQIDAALVAESGRAGRYYYTPYSGGYGCGVGSVNYGNRTTLTLNGMIATDFRYGFAYTDNTGYTNRNLNYDANLLYSPPPSFPLASTQYQTVSWKQLQ